MRARVLVLYRPSVRIMTMFMIIVYLQAQLHPGSATRATRCLIHRKRIVNWVLLCVPVG